MALTHAVVVKQVDGRASDADLAAIIAGWRDRHATTFAHVHAYRGVQSADVYVYFELALPMEWTTDDWYAFEATLATDSGRRSDAMAVDRLECVLDVPGAASGERRAFHYVVETNVADGWQDQLRRWYDTEHMPGLASVPGCIRARRFVNHDQGPRSFACYDLARAGVMDSAPWLAVRATEWSARMRPQFRNTKRTMFRELALRD
jgi:hypothetical protein